MGRAFTFTLACSLCLSAGTAWAAPAERDGQGLRPMLRPRSSAERDKVFLASKREILLLAVERTRLAAFAYQRTLKTAEERLRSLHENYKIAKSTPPTELDDDVLEMKNATQKVRLTRLRGRPVPEDPEVKKLIDRYWEDYQVHYEKITMDIASLRRMGQSEARVFWAAMKDFTELKKDTENSLIFNGPSGQNGLDDVLAKDEWKLLKAVEEPGKKRKTPGECVIAPGEHPRQAQIEAPLFFQSQGLLPTITPSGSGAFTVPVGCRTVTQREDGLNLIFRVNHGRGVAYLGAAEKNISYGYFPVPPDTAYYFENTGDQPLELDFVALRL